MKHHNLHSIIKKTINQRFVLILTVCLVSTLPARSFQESKRSLDAIHISNPPIIDGILTDEVWLSAQRQGDFVEVIPYEGRSPSQKTEFALLYTSQDLFIGVWAFDTAPDSIARRLTTRDTRDGDYIAIDIDSYHDLRTSFGFWVTSAGVKSDRIATEDGFAEDFGWNPVWDAKVNVTSEGWVAEIRIPLSQLRFSSEVDKTWGFNLVRMLYRKQEYSSWQLISQKENGYVHAFGEIKGISNISAVKNVSVSPYILATPRQSSSFSKKSIGFSAGVDAKLGLTNNSVLDISFNPDFGQVESDPSNVNLSAYETYLAERRPLFIEGKSMFDFPLLSGASQLENLFYSRRIGKTPSLRAPSNPDDEVDTPLSTTIIGAAKLSGKTGGGLSYGIFASITAEEKAKIMEPDGDESEYIVEPGAVYLAGALQKDFNRGNSVISGLITNVTRRLDESSTDLFHSSAWSTGLGYIRFFKHKTFKLQLKTYISHVEGSPLAIMRTQLSSVHYFQNPDISEKYFKNNSESLTGTGAYLSLGKVGNANLLYGFFIRAKSPEFEVNDIGYLRKSDQITGSAWLSYQIYKPFSLFRSMSFYTDQWAHSSYQGIISDGGLNFNYSAAFKNYWVLGLGYSLSYGGKDPVVLRGGSYLKLPGYNRFWMNLRSDNRRVVTSSLNLSESYGRGWDNRFTTITYELTVKPSGYLNLSLIPSYTYFLNELQFISRAEFGPEIRNILTTLGQKTLSTALRANLLLSPEMSLQLWTQPFVSGARFSEPKFITDPFADKYADRFNIYIPEQITSQSSGYYLVDEDLNTTPDYYFYYQSFNVKEFKSNLVYRWEFRPGSVLHVVWSHNRFVRQAGSITNTARELLSFGSLPADNRFMIKISFRIGT